MKISILIDLALLAATYVSNVVAQSQLEVSTSKPKVAEEVRLAGTNARVETNPLLIEGFVSAAANQKGAFAGVYRNVPKDVRVARLASYLTAKELANAGVSSSGGPRMAVGDFHWGYLTHELSYAAARLEAPVDAMLVRVDFHSGLYEFSDSGQKIRPGTALVMPAVDLTATFELGNRKAVWTGNPAGGIVRVVAASTNRGCEIFVRSKPSNAMVYFNGKEWYRRTDTSSVRDAGMWEVVVKLEGYKDWRQQQLLGAGESWTIDATLSKP